MIRLCCNMCLYMCLICVFTIYKLNTYQHNLVLSFIPHMQVGYRVPFPKFSLHLHIHIDQQPQCKSL